MGRIIFSLFFGVIFSTLSVAVVYNFITKYGNPYLTASSLIVIFGCLTHLNFYFFRIKFLLAFLFTVIPVILIDASVIITYPALVPMRFPIASFFPIMGSLLAWTITNKKIFLLLSLSSIVFVAIYGYFLYPKLLYRKMKADQLEIGYSNSIFDIPLITIKGDTIRLTDTLNAKLNIVELFFVGCVPCEKKAIALNKVSEKYDKTKLLIINICSGAHTPISKFYEYTSKKEGNGFAYFYSPDSTLGKIYAKKLAFPFEQMFTEKKEFISKEVGYDPSIEKEYISNKIKQIEKYIK